MDIERIKKAREVSIHSLYGIANNGRKLRLPCPIHHGTDLNFLLDPDNGYKCFVCEARGHGAIDFLMALGATFGEALEELDKYA